MADFEKPCPTWDDLHRLRPPQNRVPHVTAARNTSTAVVDELARRIPTASSKAKSMLKSVLNLNAELSQATLASYVGSILNSTDVFNSMLGTARERTSCIFDVTNPTQISPPPVPGSQLVVQFILGWDFADLNANEADPWEYATAFASACASSFTINPLYVDVIAVPVHDTEHDRWILGLMWPRRLLVQALDPCVGKNSFASLATVEALRIVLAQTLINSSHKAVNEPPTSRKFAKAGIQKVLEQIKAVSATQAVVNKCPPNQSGALVCLLVHSLVFKKYLTARAVGGESSSRLSRSMPFVPWAEGASWTMRAHIACSIADGTTSIDTVLPGTPSTKELNEKHPLFSIDLSSSGDPELEEPWASPFAKMQELSKLALSHFLKMSKDVKEQYTKTKTNLERSNQWLDPIVRLPQWTRDRDEKFSASADSAFGRAFSLTRSNAVMLWRLGFSPDIAVAAAKALESTDDKRKLIETANALVKIER